MGKVKKKIIYYWSPSNYLKQSIHNHFKMQRVIHKCLFPYVALKFPTLEKDFKYIVRDNYYCRLRQLKYVYKDYFSRRAYKEITYQSEFDQELKYALPFAYWHFLNGTLKKTISSKDTSLFYFFSKDHEERFEQRNWHNSYINYDFPNMVHSPSISFTKWARVPLKEKFSNTIFRYNKPILVIANKYNTEWGKAPINYLDIKSLEKIFDLFQDKYQIIYNRPGASYIVGDNSEILDLNEFEWIKKNYPNIILMKDLFVKHRSIVSSFNHLQLMVYSNSNNFISVHGGTAVLASYFGGKNIILSNPNHGLEYKFGEYSTIFPALSNAKIYHAKTRDEIFFYLNKHY